MNVLILAVAVCVVAVQAVPYGVGEGMGGVRRGNMEGYNRGSNLYNDEYGANGQRGYQRGEFGNSGAQGFYDQSNNDKEFTKIVTGSEHNSRSTGGGRRYNQRGGGESGFSNFGQGGRREGQQRFDSGLGAEIAEEFLGI